MACDVANERIDHHHAVQLHRVRVVNAGVFGIEVMAAIYKNSKESAIFIFLPPDAAVYISDH